MCFKVEGGVVYPEKGENTEFDVSEAYLIELLGELFLGPKLRRIFSGPTRPEISLVKT